MPRVVEGVAEEFEIVREQVGEDQQVGPRGGGGKAWQKTTLFCFKVSFLYKVMGDMIRKPVLVEVFSYKRPRGVKDTTQKGGNPPPPLKLRNAGRGREGEFWFSTRSPEMRGPLPTSRTIRGRA